MTKNIPEDEQLYTGLKKIVFEDEKDDDPYESHLATTKEEVEAALDTPPNGSLFGSSRFTVPWSWHLWVYNKYSGKDSGFAKWMTKSFGKAPILISQVNPALRASVVRSILRNNGYFRGYVDYEIIPQKNPKKSKLSYTIHLDSLFTLDSVSYVNYPAPMMTLIDSTLSESLIQKGNPFSISNLDGERTRISTPEALAPDWNFYQAYNLFRMAAILQGIAKRVEAGTASSEQAVASARGARPMADMAWQFAQKA
jgi:hypothetical protein